MALQPHPQDVRDTTLLTEGVRPGDILLARILLTTMLMVTRKAGERLLITLDPKADPHLTARDLFAEGPIEIILAETGLAAVRLAVGAPRPLAITRAPKRTVP